MPYIHLCFFASLAYILLTFYHKSFAKRKPNTKFISVRIAFSSCMKADNIQYNKKLGMDDYQYVKETLKPNHVFTQVISPNRKEKVKTGSTTSRSKQKQIITSFSKKQIHSPTHSKPTNTFNHIQKAVKVVQSPSVKKSFCQSQYYIKSTQGQETVTNVRAEDQLKVKESQLQLLASRLAKSEEMVKHLTVQNRIKTEKIEKMEQEMNALLAKTLKHLQIDQIGVSLSYECEKYKQDQRRLLKMLEKTSEYEYFSKFALMDEGVEFLRLQNQSKKTTLDANEKKLVHFCNCNQEFISESNFWVPSKIYSFGRQFLKERQGNLTMSELELMLYQLNRIWREREKKIINTLKGENIREIEKYKRRLNGIHSAQKKSADK